MQSNSCCDNTNFKIVKTTPPTYVHYSLIVQRETKPLDCIVYLAVIIQNNFVLGLHVNIIHIAFCGHNEIKSNLLSFFKHGLCKVGFVNYDEYIKTLQKYIMNMNQDDYQLESQLLNLDAVQYFNFNGSVPQAQIFIGHTV